MYRGGQHSSGGQSRRGHERNPWESGGGAHRPTDIATELAEFLEAIVTGVFALLGWFVRHPVVLGLVGGSGVWWWAWGWASWSVALGCLLVAGLVWRWRAPVAFEHRVWRHLRSGVLRLWVYGPRWPRWARASRLVWEQDTVAEPIVPRLRSVTSGPSWDEVTVRMVPGQTQRDYEHAAESLAQSRKVARCAVREVSPGVVSLGFLRRDPLASAVSLPPIPSEPGEVMNLRNVHIGYGEHGQAWRVPLLGSHVFGAGRTGSGKGSLLWGIVRQVSPAIASGRVRLGMIDPKGGMEAEIGAGLYHSYARDDPDEIIELLAARVRSMSERKAALRGKVRKVEPSVEYPLELTVIDELAAITKYLGDRKKQAEAERLLGLLLTQGRALASVVVAFVQEPTKEIVPMRGLFPYRVALRLDTPSQTDMVLGESAWERGAWADRIGVSTPGVSYVMEEGVREPLRYRAGFTPDDAIEALAREYAPRI